MKVVSMGGVTVELTLEEVVITRSALGRLSQEQVRQVGQDADVFSRLYAAFDNLPVASE
jgi:hypothetical protein